MSDSDIGALDLEALIHRPSGFRVSVHPQADIEDGFVSADGLISIRGVKPPREPVIDVDRFGNRVLVLRFDDIPVAAFRDRHGNDWVGPTAGQVQEALVFGRALIADGGMHLAVHCLQGKSRSAAIALAILADHLGPGHETEAVAALLADDPECRRAFNPGIVRFADHLLERDGRLEAALTAACPRFMTWTGFWVRQGVWVPQREGEYRERAFHRFAAEIMADARKVAEENGLPTDDETLSNIAFTISSCLPRMDDEGTS